MEAARQSGHSVVGYGLLMRKRSGLVEALFRSAPILALLRTAHGLLTHSFLRSFPGAARLRRPLSHSHKRTLIHRLRSQGIRVIATESAQDPDFIEAFRASSPDVLLVSAFPRILPGEILRIPRVAAVNCHYGLLPRHRGAFPVHSTLRSGDETGGVTFHRILPEVDAGPILVMESVSVDLEDNHRTLGKKFETLATGAVPKVLSMLESGEWDEIPQNPSQAKKWRRPRPEDGRIDFTGSALRIHNRIRGVIPLVAPFAHHEKRRFFVQSSRLEGQSSAASSRLQESPGTILTKEADSLKVAAAEGVVQLMGVRVEGGDGAEYFRDHIKVGDRLS